MLCRYLYLLIFHRKRGLEYYFHKRLELLHVSQLISCPRYTENFICLKSLLVFILEFTHNCEHTSIVLSYTE